MSELRQSQRKTAGSSRKFSSFLEILLKFRFHRSLRWFDRITGFQGYSNTIFHAIKLFQAFHFLLPVQNMHDHPLLHALGNIFRHDGSILPALHEIQRYGHPSEILGFLALLLRFFSHLLSSSPFSSSVRLGSERITVHPDRSSTHREEKHNLFNI